MAAESYEKIHSRSLAEGWAIVRKRLATGKPGPMPLAEIERRSLQRGKRIIFARKIGERLDKLTGSMDAFMARQAHLFARLPAKRETRRAVKRFCIPLYGAGQSVEFMG